MVPRSSNSVGVARMKIIRMHSHEDIGIGQDLDALVQPAGYGHTCDSTDDRNDDNLHPRHCRCSENMGEAGIDLQCAQANRDCNAEDGADDREGVNKFAGPFVNLGTQNGAKIEEIRGGRWRL